MLALMMKNATAREPEDPRRRRRTGHRFAVTRGPDSEGEAPVGAFDRLRALFAEQNAALVYEQVCDPKMKEVIGNFDDIATAEHRLWLEKPSASVIEEHDQNTATLKQTLQRCHAYSRIVSW